LEISRHSEAEISFLAIIIVSVVSLPRKHREWPERLFQASVGAFDGLILLPAATAHISSDEIDPPGRGKIYRIGVTRLVETTLFQKARTIRAAAENRSLRESCAVVKVSLASK
jgi:hypothetical protein